MSSACFFLGVNTIAMASLSFLNLSQGLMRIFKMLLLFENHSFLNECSRSPSVISWFCDIIIGTERGKRKEQTLLDT